MTATSGRPMLSVAGRSQRSQKITRYMPNQILFDIPHALCIVSCYLTKLILRKNFFSVLSIGPSCSPSSLI